MIGVMLRTDPSERISIQQVIFIYYYFYKIQSFS